MKEGNIIDRFRHNIGKLHFGADIFDVDIPLWVVRIVHSFSEVMVFDSNVLRHRSKLDRLGHSNSRQIILMHSQANF